MFERTFMNEEYNDNNSFRDRGSKGSGGDFGGGSKKNGSSKGPGTILIIILATAFTFAVIALVNSAIRGATYRETPYNVFYQHLENDEIDTVTYRDDRIQYTLKDETQEDNPTQLKRTYYTGMVGDEDEGKGCHYKRVYPRQQRLHNKLYLCVDTADHTFVCVHVLYVEAARKGRRSYGDRQE